MATETAPYKGTYVSFRCLKHRSTSLGLVVLAPAIIPIPVVAIRLEVVAPFASTATIVPIPVL